MTSKDIKQKRAEAIYEHLTRMEGAIILTPFPKGYWQQPTNFATEKVYGGNSHLIDLFPDLRFAGFKQISDRGETIKKGAKSIPIFFPISFSKDKGNEKGGHSENHQIIQDLEANTSPSKDSKETSIKGFGCMRVFNINDVVNCKAPSLEDLAKAAGLLVENQEYEKEIYQKLDSLVEKLDIELLNTSKDEAYYEPISNHIVIQPKLQYKSPEHYYRILLHELAHWTNDNIEGLARSRSSAELGKPALGVKRLTEENKHTDYAYVREEFTAEIASYKMSKLFGLGHQKDTNQYLRMYLEKNNLYKKEDWLELISDALENSDKILKHIDNLVHPKLDINKVEETITKNENIDRSQYKTECSSKEYGLMRDAFVLLASKQNNIDIAIEQISDKFQFDKLTLIELFEVDGVYEIINKKQNTSDRFNYVVSVSEDTEEGKENELKL
jgi:antirestriction protein ArdC